MDPLSRLSVVTLTWWARLRGSVVAALWALVALGPAGAAQTPTCGNGDTFTATGGTRWSIAYPWDPTQPNAATGQAWCQGYVWEGHDFSEAPNRTFTPNPTVNGFVSGTCKGESAGGFDRFQHTVIEFAAGDCGSPTPPPATCSKGAELAPSSTVWETSALTTSVCKDGCAGRARAAAEHSNGKFYVWGPFVATGGTCAGSNPAAPGEPAPSGSKPGYCPGTVNGTAVQVPCDKVKTESVSSSSSSASSPSGAASGAGTTITTTTCTGAGSCTTTTTTTTTKSDGTSETKTEEKPTEEKSFCDQNPALPICQEGKFGGSCSAGFQCAGDAVQCSIARELHQRNCEFFAPSDASAVGTAAAAAGARPVDHPGQLPDTRALTFDQSPLIGAGSCPADLTVSMGAGLPPVVVAFGGLCEVAGWLGNLLVALTALACLGIVFVKGS